MAKHLCEDDVDVIYAMANSDTFKWDFILDRTSHTFLSEFTKAYNFPMTFVMGTLIPAVAALCGSKTFVETGNFVNPLNTFTFIIGEPGCGKSRCQGRIWGPMCSMIAKKHGIQMNIDNFTAAGFQKHQIDNKGYGLITSSEGQRVLSSIHAKISKHEGEISRLNNVWDGVGDATLLKDGSRGYDSTSVSMCLFIQPEPCIAELAQLATTNGFVERLLFFSSAPCLHSYEVNMQAATNLSVFPDNAMGLLADSIFTLHKDTDRIYKLDQEALEQFRTMSDAYNESIMAKHAAMAGVAHESSEDGE